MAIRRHIVDSGSTSRRILRRFLVDDGSVSRRIRRRFVIDSGSIARQTYDGNLRVFANNVTGSCSTGGCPGTACAPTTNASVVTHESGVPTVAEAITCSWAYVSGSVTPTISSSTSCSPTWTIPSGTDNVTHDAVWRMTGSDGVTSPTVDIAVHLDRANTC